MGLRRGFGNFDSAVGAELRSLFRTLLIRYLDGLAVPLEFLGDFQNFLTIFLLREGRCVVSLSIGDGQVGSVFE